MGVLPLVDRYALFVSPLKWAVIFAPLAIVFFMSFRIDRLQPSTALGLFMLYSGLLGLMLSSVYGQGYRLDTVQQG